MYSIKQLAQKIDATYIGEDKPFLGIHFDSRLIKQGDIFVAIVAERDGHEFIPSAIKNGATVLVVNHKVDYGIPQIIVPDTLTGLGQLARVWKSQFDLPVIALTGSCGKTTTKEMLANVFKQVGNVAYTQGNFNNALGVPLTLFQVSTKHNYLIVEMGTNNPGEIPYLVSLVTPDISLITNIGACHTEGLKSLDGIMQEKGAIFQAISTRNGISVINLDDERISTYSQQLTCKQVTYSKTNHQADIHLSKSPNLHINRSQFSV
ncbi:Mur ligase family protein, partial [Francisellaceae bacterium]|nr:Mur ligase family protein [Francisellaceae bacterium]